MRSGIHRLRGIFLGGVTAVTSSAIVLGSFVLAFTEGGAHGYKSCVFLCSLSDYVKYPGAPRRRE